MGRGSTLATVAIAAAALSAVAAPASAFLAPPALPSRSSTAASSSALRMVAQPPVKPQKLDKINVLKQNSEALREPVRSQMQTEEISISHDAYQILKFHGSYMQDDRSLRKKGQEKVGGLLGHGEVGRASLCILRSISYISPVFFVPGASLAHSKIRYHRVSCETAFRGAVVWNRPALGKDRGEVDSGGGGVKILALMTAGQHVIHSPCKSHEAYTGSEGRRE